MRRRLLLFILPIFLLLPSGIRAQTGLPATPTPESCALAPLLPDQLTALVAAGFAPAGELTETKRAVDPADVEAISQVVLASLACTNANRPLQALAVYTDRYLAERFSGDAGADELGHLLAAISRTANPADPVDYIALTSVDHAVWYGDGRLGAAVSTTNALGTYVDLIIFSNDAGTWKIDQVVPGDEFIPAASPVSGTPIS
jgi:hypothetical protein